MISEEASQNLSSWTQKLSKEALVTPSTEWLSLFDQLDKEFRKFHNDTDFQNCFDMMPLDNEPGVLDRLQTTLNNNFPQIQDEILKQFAKTRTMIRINHNNKVIKSAPYHNYGTTQTRSKSCLNETMYAEMCESCP